jgi:hypothetical protein
MAPPQLLFSTLFVSVPMIQVLAIRSIISFEPHDENHVLITLAYAMYPHLIEEVQSCYPIYCSAKGMKDL